MANKEQKVEGNAPGRFYVDKECITCDACVLAAPDNFKIDDDNGHAIVLRQPADATEESMCKEAMEGCPVEAIGNDGP